MLINLPFTRLLSRLALSFRLGIFQVSLSLEGKEAVMKLELVFLFFVSVSLGM